MKTRLLFTAVVFAAFSLQAAPHRHFNHEGLAMEQPARPDERGDKGSREKWFKEVRELKHQFLIKELGLKKEQQQEFFNLYDKMEEENFKVQAETRAMERRVNELGDKASDLEYEKAADALFEAKQKEGEIDLKYRNEFKKVLSPQQMFRLKSAERKFTRELMDRHQQIKQSNKKVKN